MSVSRPGEFGHDVILEGPGLTQMDPDTWASPSDNHIALCLSILLIITDDLTPYMLHSTLLRSANECSGIFYTCSLQDGAVKSKICFIIYLLGYFLKL